MSGDRMDQDDCAHIQAHYAVFSVPQAAALWCGVPENELEAVLKNAVPVPGSGMTRMIWRHPEIKCLEPRCRAIAEAIESGLLPYGREDGTPVEGHIAYERRHFFGRDMRKWLEQAFKGERPAFLFDPIERNTHSAISADSYRTLVAERDALRTRLENAKEEYRKLRTEKKEIETELDTLKHSKRDSSTPGDRAEGTYKNIIAALLRFISGEVPGIAKHPSYENDSQLIRTLDHRYDGYPGLSQSTLSRKFPEAKRHLDAQS